MIRTEALSRLRLLVGAMRPPLVSGARDRELPPMQPGQAIQARVEQQTPGGHLVSVNGRVFEFKLPEGTRPGDFLRLVYVNSDPRPTFALLRVERAASQADAKLSDAGRLLSALRDITESEAAPSRAQSTAPVLPEEFPATSQVAILLRDTLSMSGLFYESHQAQWVMGSRSISQLEQEPQGQLPPLPPAPTEAETRDVRARPHPGIAGEAPDLVQVPEDGAELLPAGNSDFAAGGADGDATPARLPAHPDSFPLIRQQLAALESGVIAWRWEVWPGQTMDWEVGEAPDPEHPEAAHVWRMELRLELPRLGEIQARIELGHAGVRLQLLADSDEHRAALQSDTAGLASALSAAGLAVTGMEVRIRGS